MKNEDLKVTFESIKEKRKESFQELFDEHFRTIYGIAFTVSKNEEISHDAVQNVMLKLFTLPEDKFPTQNELSWLYTVTKNETLSLLRREKRVENIEELELPATKTAIDDFVDMQSYYSIIKGLTKKQKEIVTLKVLGDMTHRQIAELLHMKAETVQWIYKTAIDKLRIKILASGAFSLIFASVFSWRLWNFMKMSHTPNDNIDVYIDSIPEPTPLPLDISLVISGILLALSVVVFSCLLVKKIKQSK